MSSYGSLCFSGEIHGLDVFGPRRCVQAEAPDIAEAIEDLATGMVSDGTVVFALVEKGPRLLTFVQVVEKCEAVLSSLNFRGNIAIEHRDALVQSLEETNLWVVALDNALRGKQHEENFGKERLSPLGSLVEGLDDQVVFITLDD